jgi:hypothetical protein
LFIDTECAHDLLSLFKVQNLSVPSEDDDIEQDSACQATLPPVIGINKIFKAILMSPGKIVSISLLNNKGLFTGSCVFFCFWIHFFYYWPTSPTFFLVFLGFFLYFFPVFFMRNRIRLTWTISLRTHKQKDGTNTYVRWVRFVIFCFHFIIEMAAIEMNWTETFRNIFLVSNFITIKTRYCINHWGKVYEFKGTSG